MRNKKGFTLIEMLVVIAIIAILVAIIIPTVTSATTKAAAATNAANLRSYKAEIATSYLAGDGKVTVPDGGTTAAPVTVTTTLAAPAMKDVGSVDFDTCTWVIKYDGSDFIITANGYALSAFATVAEKGGTLPALGE